ncbi:MAG: M15 family metallopeptidase [Gammaproteobacteria bacterium]|nr:M15 family metallopeptidase [Gammaproteobacteria bacterium]
MQEEAQALVRLGEDCFGREQFATAETLGAWAAMREAAETDGVELQIVSAYRSVDYQCQLIQRKLDRGERIDDIMKVNAAPGFSEHHTGRALDLGTPGCEVLTEVFETTHAFRWLTENATRFGFTLSYPRGNPFGIRLRALALGLTGPPPMSDHSLLPETLSRRTNGETRHVGFEIEFGGLHVRRLSRGSDPRDRRRRRPPHRPSRH